MAIQALRGDPANDRKCWAWLMARQGKTQSLSTLADWVLDPRVDDDVQRVAMTAYWELATVAQAISLEQGVIEAQNWDLALVGLQHPQWWNDSTWGETLNRWVGQHPKIDTMIAMLWSWSNHHSPWVRIPVEVFERIAENSAVDADISWQALLTRGADSERKAYDTQFEAFWHQHIQNWVDRWFRYEQAVWRYRWRLQEERQLVDWTHSEPFTASLPEVPGVRVVPLPEEMANHRSLLWVILGLGYEGHHEASLQSAGRWDSIWSSWTASLHYKIFETASNTQTTEWHVAALTGALRDGHALSPHNLRLD